VADFLQFTEEKRMAKPIQVTDQTFDDVVINADQPILVDFWAEWCGPCKRIAPVLEELATELEGQLVIGKLDVDENPDTSAAYAVLSIPTLLLFKGGEPVDRIVGAQPKAQLLKRLQPHLTGERAGKESSAQRANVQAN
jgi:thioredoxin 1